MKLETQVFQFYFFNLLAENLKMFLLNWVRKKIKEFKKELSLKKDNF